MRNFVKTITTILLLQLLTIVLFGQTSVHLTFPDSLKKKSSFFSPYVKFDVSPSVIGVINFNDPYDSVQSYTTGRYLWTTEHISELPDSLERIYTSQKGLQILVDTTQEIRQEQYFNESFDYDSLIASPRYVKLLDQKGRTKVILCKHNMTIGLTAMPVYIVNSSKDTLHILDRDFTVDLVQEVLDRNGNWKEIEQYWTGACGMAWGWKNLHPKEMLVTSVLKYKGDFKTLARLRLDNGQLIYSQPYSISINSDLLSVKVQTTVMDGNLFELK